MGNFRQFNRISIGVVESIIIVNVIFFIPSLLFMFTKSTGNAVSGPMIIFNLLFNLNVNKPDPFLNFNNGAYWQVVTAMFMHGDFFHLFFNMYGLYIFGKPMENLWGKGKFILFYFVTGILTNLLSAIIFILSGNPLSLIGASGAVYAVLLAFAAYYPETRLLLFFIIPLKVKWAILLFTGIELFSQLSNFKDGIAHFAHLFGFLFAFLYLLIFFRINAIQKLFFPKKDDYIIY